MKSAIFEKVLLSIYPKLNKKIQNIIRKNIAVNEFENEILRKIYIEFHDVDIGMYSYGCFDVSRFPEGTKIGRYCSFTTSCHIFNGNHRLDCLSTHPFLSNTMFPWIQYDVVNRNKCQISDDVWIGHNAIILPSVSNIGRGAVIGAGSVVTKNVHPYTIVAGNPAKVIRQRFDERTITNIENSKWWKLDKNELVKAIKNNANVLYNMESFNVYIENGERLF